MAEYRHYANPDPQWVDFPNNLPQDALVTRGMTRAHDPIKAQSGLDIVLGEKRTTPRLFANLKSRLTSGPRLNITEFDVKVRDGAPITIRSYRQTSLADEALPLFMYMHGGGFVTGGLETDDSTLRAIAQELGLLVLSVEYRLAPENKFPVGFEDCFDIVRWVTTTASQIRLKSDLSKAFILGGTSAGANFTAGIAHLASEEGLSPPLSGLVFLAGSFCHPDVRPAKYLDRILSVDEINDAPGLTRKSIDYFAGKYGAPPSDRRLSPLLFDSHAGIAKKAYFAICGWDPRRDEALLLNQLLNQAQISTKLHVYPGLPHGFWTTCPELPVTEQWLQDLLEGIRWLLG